MVNHRHALLLCGAFAIANPALAQDVSKIRNDLEKKIEALESATATQKELAAKEASLRQELSGLQKQLVGAAHTIRTQEKHLSTLEQELQRLEEEERTASANLQQRQKELATLTQSMLKLSTVPPELVVAMPGDFNETMRTAKVLGLTSTALSDEAKSINRQLQEVAALQKQIRLRHEQITSRKTDMEQQLSQMEQQISARGRIQNQLLSRQEEQQMAVKQLSSESASLRELMSQLEARRKAEAQKAAKLAMIPVFKPAAPDAAPQVAISAAPTPKPQGKPTLSTGFAKAKGNLPLPAEGTIFLAYGDKTPDGDESQGIRIRTRAGAQVTAPFAGEVVYTGTFLDYGNMVIIRHENDYHSLLAGIDRVTTTLGQQLLKGEPIGEMGRTETQTALYMEIRERNRPIDPIPWLDAHRIARR